MSECDPGPSPPSLPAATESLTTPFEIQTPAVALAAAPPAKKQKQHHISAFFTAPPTVTASVAADRERNASAEAAAERLRVHRGLCCAFFAKRFNAPYVASKAGRPSAAKILGARGGGANPKSNFKKIQSRKCPASKNPRKYPQKVQETSVQEDT